MSSQFVRVASIQSVFPLGGVVAKNDRFEVWAFRHRAGNTGERHYRTGFEVVEVLSHEPRRVQDVTETLPSNCRSNLKNICAHLEARS
jgi:hypothetical protein